MYSVEYRDKYVKVIDKRNDTVIASGKVIGTKNAVENNGISFDNKWFFRKTKTLDFEVVDFVETKLCDDPESLDLNCSHLTEVYPEDIDVIRDYGYDEIDIEIRDYVYRLNEITTNIKTTTSCCGHGREPWYIEFEFSEFHDMSKFINVVETFGGQLQLFSNTTSGPVMRTKNIHLILKPNVDDWDFKLLNKFCRKLEMIM